MAGLSVLVLGPVSAWQEGQQVGSFRTRLAQALLIYLACRPERHRREHIMALLWPGLPQASAQQNLRQNLYFLRQTIPTVAAVDGNGELPLLLATRDTIQLHPNAAIAVDATRFAQLIDLLRPSQEQLREAAALYRGDFLADFYLPDSNPFEEWAAARREALRRGALVTLERLTALALTENDHQAAEAYARQQLAIDALHETANRQLIEILARAGRRSAALHHYDDYRHLLQTDLGIRPGSETLRLVEHIRSGELEAVDARPESIRGYEIIEELGRGSFNTVFRAAQPSVQREVAIKVIAARYADDADFIRRFEIEAQTIAGLEHAHIVPLYDFWREPGGAFLVMRYLRGGNLKTAVANGGWPLDRVAQLVDQMAAALHMAHRHGIVHRDVKPANILLDTDGNAYLSDFGIAQLLQRHGEERRSDAFEGTPDYVAPEQARGKAASPLSDQYSLGLVIYEALIGRPPFEADSLQGIFQKQLHEPLPSVCAQYPETPLAVDEVLRRATAKESSDRFPNILAFAHAFRAAVEHSPLRATAWELPTILANPYKGLLSFNEVDADLFYGRETLTRQLLARLANEGLSGRFLAVVGPSGSGKSSLVKAGLVPALRGGAIPGSEKWFIIDMVPGARPYAELEAALLRISVNPPASLLEQLQTDERGLLRAIRQVLPAGEANELVLLIDQFEELFFMVPDREVTARFLDSLVAAVTDPYSPLRVIVTLRADFYDRPLLYPGLCDLMQQGTEVVVPLSTDELARAIERPASRMAVAVEPELVAALVADVNEQPGALPLLQYSLSELFEQRVENRLTLAAYRQFGGIGGALSRRADAVYSALDEADQAATHALFSRLVTLGEGVEDTRRRVLLSEVQRLQYAGEQGQHSLGHSEHLPRDTRHALLTKPLDQFGAARLLSFDRDPATRGPTVEIAHEALLRAWPRLRAWLDDDRATLRLARQLTQATAEWQQAQRSEGFLLRGSRLDLLAPLAKAAIALTEEERQFLDASLAARAARRADDEARRQGELAAAQSLATLEQQRAAEQAQLAGRLRRQALVLAGALLVAAILAVVAFDFARSAAQNATLAATREAEALAGAALASSRELSLAAANTLDDDPELSILLALQALETSETRQAQEALHQALQTSRTLGAFPTNAVGSYGALFATSPDGTTLATADETTISLWNTADGDLMDSVPLMEPTTAHFHLAFNEAGTGLALVSATPDRTQLVMQTWELAAERTVVSTMFAVAADGSANVTLSPDWSLLAVGRSGAIEVWATSDRRQLATLAGHEDDVVAVVFDRTGQHLATASRDGQVLVWDVATVLSAAQPQPAIALADAGHQAGAGALVHMTFVDQTILVVGYLGRTEVWNLTDNGQPDFALVDAAPLTRAFAVNPALTSLATGGQDGTAQIFDLATGNLMLTLAEHQSPVDDLAFTADGNRLITLDRNGQMRLWDARLQALGERAALSIDPAAFDIALRPDGQQMAIGSAGGPAALWSLPAGERLASLSGDVGGVYRVAYSPDGRQLATVGTDNQVRIWDTSSGERLLVFTAHGDGVAAGLFPGTLDVAYSPDGTRLVTVGADGLAKVWDAADGRLIMSLMNHTDSLLSVAWSPDGRLIATTSDEADTSVRLWDASTGAELHKLSGHPVRVWGLAFSPDSRMLVTGGARGVIKAWDTTNGDLLYTVNDVADHIGTVTFTPDGQYFLTTGETPLRVRRSATGQEVLTLSSPLIWSAAISADGRWIYAADAVGMVRVLALHTEDAIALAHQRLTRWWRPEECQTYLHTETCPPAPVGLMAQQPGE